MSCLDALREWFQRWESVWSFLTGVGTILLAIVTAWLATRKPKVRLTIAVEKFRDVQTKITIINVEESLPVLRTWYWATPTIAPRRLDLPGVGQLTDGKGVFTALPRRMEPGDELVGYVSIRDLAQLVDPLIQNGATREQIDAAVRPSEFGCVTTVGLKFKVALPPDVQQTLAEFIALRRAPPP